MIIMDVQVFETYLKQTQQIAQRLPSDPSALLDIMQMIERHKLLVNAHPKDWEEFFKGESTFYSGQYEKALQHYLGAKEIPHYHFFCFRTSCFVARARGNQDQAINFAKKALKLNSNDEILKQFLHDLNAVSPPKPAENIPKISLGEKEMAELASIFEEPPQENDELFSREFNESRLRHVSADDESQDKFRPFIQEEAVSEEPPQAVNEPSLESSMRTGADIFSSPASHSPSQDSLTQRLYALKNDPEKEQESSLATLKKLAQELPEGDITDPYVNNHELEKRIEEFQERQSKRLKDYLQHTNQRMLATENALFILNGWDKSLPFEIDPQLSPNTQGLILTEQTRRSTGGVFLRWNGKGVVINPGAGFLNHFHEQGFSLQDIHAVVVTSDHFSAYADIKEICELNNKLNKLSGQLQIIHYYLNQKAFQELSSILKPHFKQARNALHSLEMFIDSPDVEKIDISEDISLNYFMAMPQEPSYGQSQGKGDKHARSTLGIRLELKKSAGDSLPIRIGYISGTAWSPMLAHHLGVCEILVSGFGNTSPNDYTKTGYQEDCLGYHGAYSLLEEIAPKLFISTEYDGREGDIRIEVIKKLRTDIANCGRKAAQETSLIPGDIGLHIGLDALMVKCSVTDDYISPKNLRIAKSTDAFGRLLYLSPACYL